MDGNTRYEVLCSIAILLEITAYLYVQKRPICAYSKERKDPQAAQAAQGDKEATQATQGGKQAALAAYTHRASIAGKRESPSRQRRVPLRQWVAVEAVDRGP